MAHQVECASGHRIDASYPNSSAKGPTFDALERENEEPVLPAQHASAEAQMTAQLRSCWDRSRTGSSQAESCCADHGEAKSMQPGTQGSKECQNPSEEKTQGAGERVVYREPGPEKGAYGGKEAGCTHSTRESEKCARACAACGKPAVQARCVQFRQACRKLRHPSIESSDMLKSCRATLQTSRQFVPPRNALVRMSTERRF